MAAQGAHVRNAFVTTALCSPSRASILTGQYASRHGIIDNVARLAREQGLTVLSVTHHPAWLGSATRVVRLDAGQIAEAATN